MDILLGALIGALFTLITQYIWMLFNRKRIKETIKSFLTEIIRPKISIIELELKVVPLALDNYGSGDITLGMHPTFNPTVLQSFEMVDLQAIYGKNFNKIINIIGYLENLEQRLPHIYFKNYMTDAQKHMDENFEPHRNLYF